MSSCTIFPNKRFLFGFCYEVLVKFNNSFSSTHLSVSGQNLQKDKQYETRFLIMMTTLFQFGDDLRVIVFVRL